MTLTILPERGIEEELSWLTDILPTENNTESRQSLRRNPRNKVTGRFAVVDFEERRELLFEVEKNLASPKTLPLWPYAAPLTQTSSAGTNRIYFSPGKVQLIDSDPIVLLNPETREFETAFVSVVESDGATLAANLSQEVGAGWFAIRGLIALHDNRQGFDWQHVTGTMRVGFQSFDSQTLLRSGNAATLTTLDGLPVLERTFLAGGQELVLQGREEIDNNTGKQEVYSGWLHAVRTGNRVFKLERNETDLDYWFRFLDTVRGSWKPFLLSTQLPDLTLGATPVAGASTITVNETELEPDWAFETFKHIELLYSDGTKSFHTIDSSAGGVLTLAEALPNDPKVTDVTRVSYLLKCRGGDKVRLRHLGLDSAVSMNITTTDDG